MSDKPQEVPVVFNHLGVATIITRSCVSGTRRQLVTLVKVTGPQPYAQFDRAYSLEYREPLIGRRRRVGSAWLLKENVYYVEVEVDGKVVFDSRDFVPVDMVKWHATVERLRRNELESLARRTGRTVDALIAENEEIRAALTRLGEGG